MKTPLLLTLAVLASLVGMPLASAGLPDDVRDGAEDAADDCPTTPLTTYVICTVTNNGVVKVVLLHVQWQQENLTAAADFTVAQAWVLEGHTRDYANEVSRATREYAGETGENERAYEAALRAVAAEALAYGIQTIEGECYFLLDESCLYQDTGGDRGVGGILDGDDSDAPAGCGGLVHMVRCHYTTETYEAANASLNATWDSAIATLVFGLDQTFDTLDYEWDVESATYEYRSDAEDVAYDLRDYMYGLKDRECALLVGEPVCSVTFAIEDGIPLLA